MRLSVLFSGIFVAFAASATFGSDAFLIEDINKTPATFSSTPADLAYDGTRLWFSAFQSDIGREVWTSDGTEAGTSLFLDVETGNNRSDAKGFYPYGGYIFFSADSVGFGRELWRSDGTPEGTERQTNLTFTGGPSLLTGAGEKLFFVASTKVYVHDILTKTYGEIPGFGGDIATFTTIEPAGDSVYFWSDTVGKAGLWKSNGLAEGTHPILSPDGNAFTRPTYKGTLVTAWKDGIVFAGSADDKGIEL